MKRTIGFIGTGLMGTGMARCLVRAGHAVRVHNRTRAKAQPVLALGAEWAGSPAVAARGADVVISMLADSAAVLGAYDGVIDTISPGAIAIDASTIAPAASQRLAQTLGARGCAFLDAPVFGSKNEAENGQLGFMVGGPREAFQSVRDLLVGCMGTKAFHVGPSGMGCAAKLVVNAVIATTLQACSEALVLATKAGIDPATMAEVLLSSRARSGIAEMKLPGILRRDFTPFFALRLMDKDLKLVLEAAHALGAPLPLAQATQAIFAACREAGQSEEDFSSIIKHSERLAGVEV